MIIDLYYSTIGLFLDIMIITVPILFHFKTNKKTRVKTYTIVYVLLLVVLGFLNNNPILNFLVMFSIISLAMYFIIKVDFRKLFLYVTYFAIMFIFDYAYIFMTPFIFVLYSTIYKLVLLKANKLYIELDMELKEKILSGASVSGIIILAIIMGGIYV